MQNKKSKKDELDRIFSPRSVAVVGASENIKRSGYRFLKSFITIGFKGSLYAINPSTDKVFHCPAYPRITDVPGNVDHVVVCVPSIHIPSIIQDCVDKSVNSVVVFSSEFSETGTEEGRLLEEELVKIARKSHLRIIGPNCMGIYCPSSGLSFRLDMPKRSGTVAMISQSGGMAISSLLSATERNIFFSKVISYGNEADLGAPELLEYLSVDDNTSIIMVYIEGTKNGRELFSALKKACSRKPVIVLKGGISNAGARAVESHTGALSGIANIWASAVNQSGGSQVYNLEEFIDTALAFNSLKRPKGRRLGIITVSGGIGVNLSDLAIAMNFEVPLFSKEIEGQFAEIITAPGTGVQNPLDMAATYFIQNKFRSVFNIIDQDKSLDLIMMHISMEYVSRFTEINPKLEDDLINAVTGCYQRIEHPFFVVIPYTIDDDIRKNFIDKLLEHNIPIFPTIERALNAIDHCIRYYQRIDSMQCL